MSNKSINKLCAGALTPTTRTPTALEHQTPKYLKLISILGRRSSQLSFHDLMLQEHIQCMNSQSSPLHQDGHWVEIERYAISTCVSPKWAFTNNGKGYLFGRPKYLMAYNCNAAQKAYLCRNLSTAKIDYWTIVSSDYAEQRFWIICNYVGTLNDIFKKMRAINSNAPWVSDWISKCTREKSISFRAYPKHGMLPTFGTVETNFVIQSGKTSKQRRRSMRDISRFSSWVGLFKAYWLHEATATFVTNLRGVSSPLMQVIRNPIIERQRAARETMSNFMNGGNNVPAPEPAVNAQTTSPHDQQAAIITDLLSQVMNRSNTPNPFMAPRPQPIRPAGRRRNSSTSTSTAIYNPNSCSVSQSSVLATPEDVRTVIMGAERKEAKKKKDLDNSENQEYIPFQDIEL